VTNACETRTQQREREKEKENGQRREREKEKKNFPAGKKKVKQRARKNIIKDRLFSSHLRRFCTRRWLLFGTARLPRRPRSSVRLSICPSFSFSCGLFVRLMTIEFVLFSFFFGSREMQRDQREKGSDFPTRNPKL
jgi:hypothetical protein